MCADLHRFSKVSFSPLTGHILAERKTNVPLSRLFTFSGAEFKWATILPKFQNVCQNVLLCPYICKTSLNEVNTYIHIAVFIILCMCHAHYMHVFVVLRKFLICKWENQLLSRQIEAIKLHFLDDYLMKIVFPLFRFVYLYAKQKYPASL